LRPVKSSILDKTLNKGKGEVSLSIYALLFSEIIQYSQKNSNSIGNLSEKLHSLGFDVGTRLLDLYVFREKNSKRETKLINMLLFIKTTLWKVKHNFFLFCADCYLEFITDTIWQRN
jgi:trafficking protein particle complex subunit 5